MHRLKRILRNEAGFALPMALVLMLLGGFLIGVSANLAATTLKSNIVFEQRTEGLYAADAGIEDVVWKYKDGQDPFSGGNSYLLTEQLNGMTVTVERLGEAQTADGTVYTIKSTARLNGEIKGEIIAELVGGFDFSWLFEHAITSGGSVTTKSSDIIYGGILYENSYDGNADVRSGVVEQGTVNLPTEAQLSAFYLSKFDDIVCANPVNYCPANPYPSSSYSIPSGTSASNPHMIPWLYRNGNLSITGNGYAKLSGTVYVTGKFSVDDKNSIIDLNGNSIYSKYYNNCSGDAIYFKPGCTVYGPGCVIGVGNVNFQPNLGMGAQLLGAADVDGCNPDLPDRFLLSRFKATATNKLTSFQVKCSGEGKVKVALYADSGGMPGALLGAVDTSDNQTVMASWNPITFPETQITNNIYYWLAAISDSAVICKKAISSTNKYKTAAFTGFTFPNPAPPAGDFTSQTTEQYMLRGYTGSQEFIFLMSVTCSTNLQPNSSFYGSIAGNTNVNLQPGCTLNLVGLPADGLDFPGMGAGSGEGGTTDLEMRTYTIE